MILQNVKVEIFFAIILFSILFYQFQQAELKTLISILLITVWGLGGWYYLNMRSTEVATQEAKETEVLENENTDKLQHPEIQSNNYAIKTAPKKGLQFLKENSILMGIAKDLIFVKTFDRQKYQELLVFLNQYQKIYMYILAERYSCKTQVGNFLDTRENILELLYQCYIVVPSTFKHIYGVNPYKTIEKNIELFFKVSNAMIEVLNNFCKNDMKEFYFPMTHPMPVDPLREKEKQNVLP